MAPTTISGTGAQLGGTTLRAFVPKIATDLIAVFTMCTNINEWMRLNILAPKDTEDAQQKTTRETNLVRVLNRAQTIAQNSSDEKTFVRSSHNPPFVQPLGLSRSHHPHWFGPDQPASPETSQVQSSMHLTTSYSELFSF